MRPVELDVALPRRTLFEMPRTHFTSWGALVGSLGCLSSVFGSIAVQGVVETPGVSPGGSLWDLNAASIWSAEAAGNETRVLLDDWTMIEAVGVVSRDAAPSAFEFSASKNYRDWWRLAEGGSGTIEGTAETFAVDPMEWRFLRFRATDGEGGHWRSVVAGTASEMAADLELMKPVDWGDITDPATIHTMMAAAFDWQWDRVDPNAENLDWLHGAFHAGISAAARETGDPRYRAAILTVGDHADWKLRVRTGGKGLYHADDHCIGQAWLELYEDAADPDPRWIADVRSRLEGVMADPLPGRQDYNWCDALFMAPPVYARLAALLDDPAIQTYIDGQWWDASDYLYDETWHLFYRDSNYFGSAEANGRPVFWSRGNGWVIAGLVRVLQYVPLDWPGRAAYVAQFGEMANRLATIQDPVDGLWRSSLLYPERFGNEPEASGSAFFVFALAWGVNEGILNPAIFGPVVENGWAGLAGLLGADGHVAYIQQVGAAPALNNQLPSHKEYGYGAFILAGSEMARFYAAASASALELPHRASALAPRANTLAGDPAAWSRIDDLEGSLHWSNLMSSAGAVAERIADPFAEGGSQVWRVWGGPVANNIQSRRPIPAIDDGTEATLYFRLAVDDTILDLVVGLCDVDAPTGYGDYETGLRLYRGINRFEVRAGGAYEAVADDFAQLETWYEVWMVVDNASDTYDVYVQGGSQYSEPTLLRADIPFRNGTRSPLRTFVATLNPKTGIEASRGSVYLDDFYLDRTGTNLSRPNGVAAPRVSPWSEFAKAIPETWKRTPLGLLNDDAYPWVYSWTAMDWLWIAGDDADATTHWAWSTWAGWLYFPPDAAVHDGGIYAWSHETGHWWFFPHSVRRWYVDVTLNQWMPYP